MVAVTYDLTVGGRGRDAVEHGAVGRRAHRLTVELQLLLGVPQLEGARALVRRRLLPVRQRDGGRQVDGGVRQVRVRGLEAARTRALEGRGPRSVHLNTEAHIRTLSARPLKH